MVRTQIQLDEETYVTVRRIAHGLNISMSQVVRDILHRHFERHAVPADMKFTFIASGASGRHDIAERHDEVFTEDLP